MFKFPAYNKVHRTVTGTSSCPINFQSLMEKEKQEATMEAVQKHNDKVHEAFIQKQKKEELTEASFAPARLQTAKTEALIYLDTHLKDQLFAESFSSIFMRSLPHDPDFIAEHWSAISNMARLYTRKLGGFNYLKEQADKTKNVFLRKYANAIEVAAKKIGRKKTKKVLNALTDVEAMDIVRGKIDDKSKKDLLSHINDLGVDELTELVKDKVINVVKDEHIREKDERDFRLDLKNDLTDPSMVPPDDAIDKMVSGGKKKAAKSDDMDMENDDDLSGGISTGDELNDVDTVDDTSAPGLEKGEDKRKAKKPAKKASNDVSDTKLDKKASDKKSDKKDSTEDIADVDTSEDMNDNDKDTKKEDKNKKQQKTGMEGFTLSEVLSRWNPMTESFSYNEKIQPKSLMFSIATSVARDMVKSMATTEGTSITSTQENTPSYVLENPLNLDIFTMYLKDNSSDIENAEQAMIHEPKILGSNINPHHMDRDQIMTEAVMQYTLLETAYTMHLIDPSMQTIKEQSDYLLKI